MGIPMGEGGSSSVGNGASPVGNGASPVAGLLAQLVAIDSTNPGLAADAPGEAALAGFLAERLGAAGLEIDLWEPRPGRPNLVARLRGTAGDAAPNLMLVGHMDVVDASPEAFSPDVRDGRMYGRGTNDMKAGLAAAVVVAERLAAAGGRSLDGGVVSPLRGDLLIAGCADEEWESFGAEALVERYNPDAAILPERTDLDVTVEHGGFTWFEVESVGFEAAGAEPEKGVDAIALIGPVLDGIVRLDRELDERPHVGYGRGSIHAATIAGGTQLPAYPASCRLGIERCLIEGESVAQSEGEIQALLDAAAAADPRFSATSRLIVGREPVALRRDEPVVLALVEAAQAVIGHAPSVRGDIGWADSGIFAEAGIPCAQFGPLGEGEHTAVEWVDLASLETVCDVLERAARIFCG